MFDPVINLFKSLSTINQNEIIHDIIDEKDLNESIISLNKYQLYDEGVVSTGKPTGDYSPITESHYKPLAAMNGRDGETSHMTGKDSGQTYDSIRIRNGNDEFEITADDRNKVFQHPFKYGSLVNGLGLTEESIEKIIPTIKNSIIEKLKEKIAI